MGSLHDWGLDVVAVDHEAAVVSRALVLLQLIVDATGGEGARPPTWLVDAWSIFYHQVISTVQLQMVRAAAGKLLTALASPEAWAASPVGGYREQAWWW